MNWVEQERELSLEAESNFGGMDALYRMTMKAAQPKRRINWNAVLGGLVTIGASALLWWGIIWAWLYVRGWL